MKRKRCRLWMRFSKAFAQQPRVWVFAEMLTALFVIGIFDLITGYDVSFTLFYGVPIFVVAWFCDKKLAIAAALVAGIAWCLADERAGHLYLHTWTHAWEIGVHLGSFLLIALAGSALRTKRDIAADRIALLEHSQHLEREIVSISDAEQLRIGQDLHDGLCQYLAGLACSATSLRDDLEKLHLGAEATAAGELVALLQEAVVQTRDLARGLVPAHVGQVGLVLALELLAQSVTRMQGVNCTFDFRGVSKNYEDRTARHLFRIAQEAINNATRHGKARNIAISLDATEDFTTLRILDDGVGIPPGELNGSGMGLSIMRYRARQSGGELQIERAKNGGTLVWCTAKTNRDISEIAAA
jgi:signal transduction histidine kinase